MKNKKMMSAISISAMLLMATSASAFAAEVPASKLVPANGEIPASELVQAKEMTPAMEMVPATEAMKVAEIDLDDTDINLDEANAEGKELFKNLIVTVKSLVPSMEGFSVIPKDGVEMFKEIIQGAPQK